jgi:hypothetical protein
MHGSSDQIFRDLVQQTVISRPETRPDERVVSLALRGPPNSLEEPYATRAPACEPALSSARAELALEAL